MASPNVSSKVLCNWGYTKRLSPWRDRWTVATHRGLCLHCLTQCIEMHSPSPCLSAFHVLDGRYLTSTQTLPAFQPKNGLDCLPQYANMSLSFGVLDAPRWERNWSNTRHPI